MYPIPLRADRSHTVLPPEAVSALFGEGYALGGTEQVEVVVLGQPVAMAEARPGAALRLVLDAYDRASVPAGAPLHLVGPKGVLLAASPAEPLPSALVLPPGLLKAWGLTRDRRVAVAVGRVVLAGVPVEEGAEAHLRADLSVLLAGGVEPEDAAYWLPDFALPAPPETGAAESPPAPKVITENDVRRARMRREKLHVAPGQLVTPAARALGRELGVLEEPEGT